MCVNTRSSQPKCATRRYDAARSTRTAHSSCDTLSFSDGTCSVAVLMMDLLLRGVVLPAYQPVLPQNITWGNSRCRDRFDYRWGASYARHAVVILRSIQLDST